MSKFEKERYLRIHTSPCDDKLLLRSITGQEGLSKLFHFHLELLSDDRHINFRDLLGAALGFAIVLPDGSERLFHGHVIRLAQLPDEGRMARYMAEVAPWPWFLTRTMDCRIFQNKNVEAIIRKVFGELGFQDFEFHLNGTYPEREYCVQYRETAFDFVSRLLEEEGIFYYFRHEAAKHVLVLGDAVSNYEACPDESNVRYHPSVEAGAAQEEDAVVKWESTQELRSTAWAGTDYNFETPSTSLNANVSGTGPVSMPLYDYPGGYGKKSEGDRLAKIRLEEQETFQQTASGESTCAGFCAGHTFELREHPRRDQNRSWLLTSVRHMASQPTLHSEEHVPAEYRNSFEAIPASFPFRPPRVTPRPFIQGCQTAVVVGKSGEEIWVDKFGRIKVQFHWDRIGTKDQNSSCWIRVSQPWAGKGWGAMWTPRIGQEVVVGFLEGDPDRPIVTGSVYNAQQMPPWALPGNQTQSGFISNSSKGGGGNNMIRFEDKKGKEHIEIHAQYDWNSKVENNFKIEIGNDEAHLVSGNSQINVVGNTKIDIGKDQSITVGGNRVESIGGSQTIKVDGSQTETIGSALVVNVGGAEVHKVKGDAQITAGGVIGVKAGGAMVVNAGGNIQVTAGAALAIMAGGAVIIKASSIQLVGATVVAGPMAAMVANFTTYSPGVGNFI